MNRKVVLSLAAGAVFALRPAVARETVRIVPGEVEVVVAADAPKTVTFAADELTNFLSQVLGTAVPVTHAPTAGRTPILLGEALWDDPATDLTALPCDGYAFAVRNGRVHIAGKDDPKKDPYHAISHPAWGGHKFDHGTLNGVYSFLERGAGVRFYFPGELGTCVERRTEIRVREGTVTDAPFQKIRSWSYHSDGAWFEGENPVRATHPQKTLNSFRLRASTRDLGCCHGLNGFRYVDRFGKTNPEYFAVDSNGGRMIEGEGWRRGHLCFSSGIREVIFQDCLAYLKGESAESRGIRGPYADKPWGKKWDWGYNTTPNYIDLMPQDGHAMCHCEKCRAAMRRDGRKFPMTEIVWGMVKEVAERLKKEGFEPILTCMSYADYADTPDFPLPDNVRVMVARQGPWSLARPNALEEDRAFYDKWTSKTGRAPWSWTYANRESCNALNIPGVPGWAPQAWGRYYAGVAKHLYGTFAESETDRCLDQLLGYYLKAKVCWNPNFDWEAAIEEFYERMFGRAAAPMKRALETLERKFTHDVAGTYRMTDIGPVADRPSPHRLWREIYSAAEMDALKADFDAAAAAVPSGSIEGRRVALFRKWMYEPPRETGDAYRKDTDLDALLAWNRAHPDANLLDEARWSHPDTKDFVTPPCSYRMTATKKDHTQHLFGGLKPGVTLKPGTRYRFSYCVKVDLEPTARSGGVGPMIVLSAKEPKWEKAYVFPPTMNFLSGKLPWMAQTFTFETPAEMPDDFTVSVWPRIRYGNGTAWFDEIRLEEVE